MLLLGTTIAICIVVGGLGLVWALVFDVVKQSPIIRKAANSCASICCVCDTGEFGKLK